ncbi:MAG: GreA/GreB family elongation factor, partial [Candidatus Aegiribacteria sp.]|nr:GreA/GreB family elongation factor [Candidatus Aegiribacteria sp.]
TFITIDFQESAIHDMKLDVALDTTTPLESDSLTVLRWRDPSGFLHLFNSSPAEFLKRLLREPFGNPEEITFKDLVPVFKNSEIKNTEAWKHMRKTASFTPGFVDLGDRIALKDETIKEFDQIRNIINRRKCPVSDKTREIQALLKSSGTFNSVLMTDLLDDVAAISSPETGSLFELSWTLTGNGKTDNFMEIASNYIEKTSARGLRASSEIHSPSCRKLYLELFFSGEADRREKLLLMMKLKRSLWEHCVNVLERTDPELLNECIGSFLSDPSETDRFLWALCFLATHEDFDKTPFDEKQIKLFMDYLIFAKADTQKKVIVLLMGPLKEKLNGYLSSIDTRKLSNYLDCFDTSSIIHREGLFLAIGREISRRRESGAIKSLKQHFWESDTFFSSKKAIEKRKADSLHLKRVEIPAAADAIGEAASHGDLSENAEYAAAIEKRDLLLDKLRRWNEELDKYRVYPATEISASIVSPGIRVVLEISGDPNSRRVFDIVGPLDADPEKSRINYMAPVGKILLGKSNGDTVILPGTGNEKWELVSLEILEDL